MEQKNKNKKKEYEAEKTPEQTSKSAMTHPLKITLVRLLERSHCKCKRDKKLVVKEILNLWEQGKNQNKQQSEYQQIKHHLKFLFKVNKGGRGPFVFGKDKEVVTLPF